MLHCNFKPLIHKAVLSPSVFLPENNDSYSLILTWHRFAGSLLWVFVLWKAQLQHTLLLFISWERTFWKREWDIPMRVSVFPQEVGSWDVPLQTTGWNERGGWGLSTGLGSALRLSQRWLQFETQGKSDLWSVLAADVQKYSSASWSESCSLTQSLTLVSSRVKYEEQTDFLTRIEWWLCVESCGKSTASLQFLKTCACEPLWSSILSQSQLRWQEMTQQWMGSLLEILHPVTIKAVTLLVLTLLKDVWFHMETYRTPTAIQRLTGVCKISILCPLPHSATSLQPSCWLQGCWRMGV